MARPKQQEPENKEEKEHARANHPLYNPKLATAYAWNSSAQR
jgi:hypothetical protein